MADENIMEENILAEDPESADTGETGQDTGHEQTEQEAMAKEREAWTDDDDYAIDAETGEVVKSPIREDEYELFTGKPDRSMFGSEVIARIKGRFRRCLFTGYYYDGGFMVKEIRHYGFDIDMTVDEIYVKKKTA